MYLTQLFVSCRIGIAMITWRVVRNVQFDKEAEGAPAAVSQITLLPQVHSQHARFSVQVMVALRHAATAKHRFCALPASRARLLDRHEITSFITVVNHSPLA